MPAFGTETILLVDDDDRVREIVKKMEELGGYTVLAAQSGEEALEIYRNHRTEISLIVFDLIMPGMGGERCLEELLRLSPDTRVLVASGYSSNGLNQEHKLAGAKGFISKPYDAKDILTAIRKVLDEGYLCGAPGSRYGSSGVSKDFSQFEGRFRESSNKTSHPLPT
ncbi:response regulator [Thermodesulfobacteriota bacterium]